MVSVVEFCTGLGPGSRIGTKGCAWTEIWATWKQCGQGFRRVQCWGRYASYTVYQRHRRHDIFSATIVCRWFVAIQNYNGSRSLHSATEGSHDPCRMVQATFYPAKCYILRVTRKRKPLIHHYHMMGHQLETVHHYPYLGVEISDKLRWDQHIDKVTSKANRTLGFVRRNLSKCPQDIKDQAYKSLVRPHLEYASAVWDPYHRCQLDKIEMVQQKAARFVTNTYSREQGTVTNILQSLGWPTLETRRKGARLILLYKILHGEAAVNSPEYVRRSETQTR